MGTRSAVPPAAALEPDPRCVGWDGSGSAEKLAAVQSLFAGRRAGRLLGGGWDTRTLGDVRYVITLDFRYRAAARRGGDARGHDGASPQSGGVRPGERSGNPWLRDLQPRIGITLTSAESVAGSRPCTRDTRASTRTRPRCRTSTRISMARGAIPAKGSTTWTPSSSLRTVASPENTLLSHDLIEGAYSRAALATDIELYETILRGT